MGRLTQEEGAHRPGRRRNGPGWGDFGGTPLRLSHLRFKMKTLGGLGAPVTDSRLLRRLSSSTGLKGQRADSALLTELRGGPRSDWYRSGPSPWRQRLQSHNGKDGSLKRCQLFSSGICFAPVLWEYLEGAVDTLAPAPRPFRARLCWNCRPTPAFLYGARHKCRRLGNLDRLLYTRGRHRRQREAMMMLLSLDVFKLKQTKQCTKRLL